MSKNYSMSLTLDAADMSGIWEISEDTWDPEKPAVWHRASLPDEDTGQYCWPADMRAEYERLTGKPEFDPDWPGMDGTTENLVEIIAESDDCAFDQPCAYGHRVECHAVYCHNDGWLYAPRKCRRSQHDPDWRHEDCPGFKSNPSAQPTSETT